MALHNSKDCCLRISENFITWKLVRFFFFSLIPVFPVRCRMAMLGSFKCWNILSAGTDGFGIRFFEFRSKLAYYWVTKLHFFYCRGNFSSK
jgi:hypothetical protein